MEIFKWSKDLFLLMYLYLDNLDKIFFLNYGYKVCISTNVPMHDKVIFRKKLLRQGL